MERYKQRNCKVYLKETKMSSDINNGLFVNLQFSNILEFYFLFLYSVILSIKWY